jgi:hypothetical protein
MARRGGWPFPYFGWFLLVVTIVAVGVGAWFFVRDEYPFQVESDIAFLAFEGHGDGGWRYGYVDDPPPELGEWLSSMERDASGDTVTPEEQLTVVLADGRRLHLIVGGDRGIAHWIAADGTTGPSVPVHIDQRLMWYVRGLAMGLGAGTSPAPAESPGSPGSPGPTASPGSDSGGSPSP